MAKCAICGEPVPVALVMHGKCWERRLEEAAQVFCDDYCRFPRECGSQEELENRCDSCHLMQLADLRTYGKEKK